MAEYMQVRRHVARGMWLMACGGLCIGGCAWLLQLIILAQSQHRGPYANAHARWRRTHVMTAAVHAHKPLPPLHNQAHAPPTTARRCRTA